MLLSEITADRQQLINTVLDHLGTSKHFAAKRLVFNDVNDADYADDVIDEAIRLMGWSFQRVNIEDFKNALGSFIEAKSLMGMLDYLQAMSSSRFPEHPSINMFRLALKDIDRGRSYVEEARDLSWGAIAFARSVKNALDILIALNDIALGHPNYFLDGPKQVDPLGVSIVRALFKKLELTPKDLIY
jgi:hypothetical protein